MPSNEIGAVIIGRNEGRRLIACLRSVQPEIEHIVYVDSGSTDASIEAAEQFGARIVRLSADLPFTAARARNEGAATLKALWPGLRYVSFIDGDCILVQGWIKAGVDFLRRHADVAVVCGRRRELFPDASVYNQIADFEWNTPIGEAEACGGDSIVRFDAFEAAGRFDPRLIAGEEPELCIRLREQGWKIWRLDAEMTRHDMAMTQFSQWWRRSVRSGYGFGEVVLRHWRSSYGIWKRQIFSAVFWGGLLPLFIAIVACFPGLLGDITLGLAILLFPIQVVRMALRRGASAPSHWNLALFTMLSRFAILQGLLTMLWSRRKTAKLIEYK